MAYQKGDLITAATFNTFRNTVANVFGTGSGDRGYGQTPYVGSISTGATIAGTHWSALRDMINVCATHQGTSVTNLPPTTVFDAGDIITAHETSAPSSNAYDIDSYVSAIDTNRLNRNIANMTASAVAHTVTRSASWSSSISAIVDVTFASEDAARYFFNTGGEIRLRIVHTPTGTSQDSDWNSNAAKVGQVQFKAHATSSTGSSGLSSALGFYELTGTNQIILNGSSIGSGAYASNDIIFYAQRLNYVGSNGGNGNGIRFTVVLQDDHTNAFYDLVSAGTALQFEYLRATYLSGIGTPSFTTNTSFG